MMIVKKIGVMSLGKIMGALYALFGLIFGAIFSLISLLGFTAGAASQGANEAVISLIFGVGAIIALPIFYGIMGFVAGLISAFFYNFIAGMVGGLELEVEGAAGGPGL